MSPSPPTAPSSHLQAIFHDSIKAYEKKTKKDLLTHPFMAQLQTCNSPTDILVVLRAQAQVQHTRGDDRLTRWLNPTVRVLYAFSGTLGADIGLDFSPANVVFASASDLFLVAVVLDRPHSDSSNTEPIQAAKGVAASPDVLVDIFERIEKFFRRLETYTAVPTTLAMKDVLVEIMVEMLGLFAIITKEMKQARLKKYLKKFIGRRDIEDPLNRLNRLTQEEAVAKSLGLTYPTVEDKVQEVIDDHTKDHVKEKTNNIDEERPVLRPIRPQVFFGRDDELKTTVDLIFSSVPAARIAILGPGGVGKTILAHAVLTHQKVASRFRDSRYLISCESLTSRDALLAAISKSLAFLQPGMTLDSYSVGLEPRVLSALGSEECILCLDNFESPWDQPGGSRRAVEVLLADITALSTVTVLVTMRGVERPKGTAWTLPRLPPLTNFSRDAAMCTWENLAGTCDEWAEKLIDAVDCLPLAVTLLGSLAEVSTAETLWERWQKENISLVEKEKGDKLTSLEFSIALSLESNRMFADGSSKRLLGILSLLPDGMPALPSPEFRRLFSDIPDISRSLDTLLKCSLAIRTPDKRIQVNSLIRLYCERNDIASLDDRLTLASHGYDSPRHEPSEVTLSPLNPHYNSQSLTRPSSSLRSSGLLDLSLGVNKLSPMHDEGANATQPVISITPAAPQSAHLLTVSHGDSASPATSVPAFFPSRTPSRSISPATFPEHISGLHLDSDAAIMSASIGWNHSIPANQVEGYTHTRSRAIEAISDALGTAASIGNEALTTGVDLLQFAPVPGLQLAGNILLKIRDAVGMVKTNRIASLRLTERCEEILICIRDEIADTGDTVAEELREPIAKLVKAFRRVHDLLNKLVQRPFLKRYLGRNEIQSSISACDTALSDALGMFRLTIQIRTMNLIQANELRRQKETHSHLAPALPPVHLPSPPAAPQSLPADPEIVHKTLHALRAAQDAQDRARDAADLRQLMRTALAAKDDVAMFEVLQISHSDMPEAIKTLERALERVVEAGKLDTKKSTAALPSPQVEEAGQGDCLPVDPSNPETIQWSADTLDLEFIETGIGALRRLSKGADLGLPSWTITRYEIDLEVKIGVGFFSYVYRGAWRNHTVAIKVLAETTPRKIFLREVEIWKSLHHPNVLELFGASSASGEPPWFLVSKYYPRGSLVKYLQGLSKADTSRVDALKMIHEISEGMAYLHKQGVLHGDLKAANILVDNDTRCVISDFGQSEMKSEVYRITRTSQPRGTLRWQAPELMQGTQTLTTEIDVYAFAICCGEILTMGAVPWSLIDDDTVRHLVLNENKRPSLPLSNLVNGQLMNIIHASWDRIPSNRPSFEQIASEIKRQRAARDTENTSSHTFDTRKQIPPVAGWDSHPDAAQPRASRQSFVTDFSQCLHEFVVRLLPTVEELAVNEDVRKLLERIIRSMESESRLLCFGSTANGFSLRNSDMNLCCLIDSEERPSATDFITMLGDLLERETKFHVKPLPHARIPIVEFSLDPSPGLPLGIACDISFENRLALENTRLLYCYTMIDPTRVRTLVLFLKVWCKRRKIDSPYNGTLSSYGYVLLAIYFLVHVKNPPVLPNLQQMSPMRPISHEDTHIGGHNTWFCDDVELLQQRWRSANTDSVGQLLIDFFKYFSRDFLYNTSVASIRAGLIMKDSKGWQNDLDPAHYKDTRERNRFCIEDPFETDFNVAQCVTRDGLYTLRGEFMRASRILSACPKHAIFAITQLCEEQTEALIPSTSTE